MNKTTKIYIDAPGGLICAEIPTQIACGEIYKKCDETGKLKVLTVEAYAGLREAINMVDTISSQVLKK
jgi:hypothetical protein